MPIREKEKSCPMLPQCLQHRRRSALAATVDAWPELILRILILQGGSRPRRPRNRPGAGVSTRCRGVMAVGNGQGQWVLVNMSPAVAHQLDSDPRLHRHAGLADAQVRAVVLTDPQVDPVGGLLSLRDGAPIDLYATPAVFEQLTTALPVLPVLQHYCGVHWHVVPVAGDRRVAEFRVDGLPSLAFTAVATQAAPPPHLADSEPPKVGDSIALAVQDLDTGQRVFCAPGLARIGEAELVWMRGADCLLLDQQDSPHTGLEEPLWMTQLRHLPARHKVLFGPAARASQREACAGQGIVLAYDGMEIEI